VFAAGELDLALDVYRQMQNEGCTPNLVTYNTLIDVHGKTGAWEDAIAVLDAVEKQGLEPEARTYNTVIIACNQSSKAAEALQVYDRMLRANAKPTATTYTALISAYGKAGQLDAALQIFQDMTKHRCERNVITFSSLISACEKAGRWEIALDLLKQMHREGCEPNVVTYNSLIAACAQGAQAQKAQEIFDQMQKRGCRPDSVTFGALIGAYDKAGDWRSALSSFEAIRLSGCRPDTVVFNTIIGCLWNTGIIAAQERAIIIFHMACRQGHFRMTVTSDGESSTSTPQSAGLTGAFQKSPGCSPRTSFGDEGTSSVSPSRESSGYHGVSFDTERSQSLDLHENCSIEFGMHAFTIGSAVLCLMRWLVEINHRLTSDTSMGHPGDNICLVLNKGKPSREHTYPAIKEALVSLLKSWNAPLDLFDISIGCKIKANKTLIADWLQNNENIVKFLLEFASYADKNDKSALNDYLNQEDAVSEARCAEAFAAVRQFEKMQHETISQAKKNNVENNSSEIRWEASEWFARLKSMSNSCCYPDEVLYDGFDILHRAMVVDSGKISAVPQDVMVAACLTLAASQSGNTDNLTKAVVGAAEKDAGISDVDVEHACNVVKNVLNDKTSSISCIRVMKLYIERLGCAFEAHGEFLGEAAGSAFEHLPVAIVDEELKKFFPSTVAAALLIVGRKNCGKTPFWPDSLAHLTGLNLNPDGYLKHAMVIVKSLVSGDRMDSIADFVLN